MPNSICTPRAETKKILSLIVVRVYDLCHYGRFHKNSETFTKIVNRLPKIVNRSPIRGTCMAGGFPFNRQESGEIVAGRGGFSAISL